MDSRRVPGELDRESILRQIRELQDELEEVDRRDDAMLIQQAREALRSMIASDSVPSASDLEDLVSANKRVEVTFGGRDLLPVSIIVWKSSSGRGFSGIENGQGSTFREAAEQLLGRLVK